MTHPTPSSPASTGASSGPNAKERPILFSAPMIRALLAGQKTMTRRIVKPQFADDVGWAGFEGQGYLPVDEDEKPLVKPRYFVGDRLWVKETWQAWTEFDGLAPTRIPEMARRNINYLANGNVWDSQKRASIHMPRWASRITIEISDVRVERLQDISAKDAMSEGIAIPPIEVPAGESPDDVLKKDRRMKLAKKWAGGFDAGNCQLARVVFSELWESINGKGSWASNPWVFAIEFKRI